MNDYNGFNPHVYAPTDDGNNNYRKYDKAAF